MTDETDSKLLITINILKRSRDFLLYTKKEKSRVLFTIKYGCHHGSKSMLLNLPSAKPNDILTT